MPNKSSRHYDDGTHRFDYTVILKPRLKHRYIRIRNGEVIVTAATRTADRILEAFVAAKAEWITRHLHESQKSNTYDLTQPQTPLYWRGERCTIAIERGKQDQLRIEGGTARFTSTSSPRHEHLLSLLQRYRKKHAPSILLPRIRYWSDIMDLHPTHVSFRHARTRWGSCSSRNAISLNTHLLMLPDDLIDYVIIHELAHIKHKNHGSDFWNRVSRYASDWKKSRKEIRRYEKYLI